MTSDKTPEIRRYQKILERVAKAKTAAAKAAGQAEMLMKQLQETYSVASVEEAEALLETLREEAEAAKAEFTTLMDEFEEDWGETVEKLLA